MFCQIVECAADDPTFCLMRILHLSTHSSGGSHECAALLCGALLTEGIDGRLYCRPTGRTRGLKGLLDRVVRSSYVSWSREPWHGTRRLLPAPPAEELNGVDVVHLHTVADWFNGPSWLETLPSRIGVVISLHDMWHFTGGCFTEFHSRKASFWIFTHSSVSHVPM